MDLGRWRSRDLALGIFLVMGMAFFPQGSPGQAGGGAESESTDHSGSAGKLVPKSTGTEDSEQLRYKAKVYRGIDSRWRLYVRQDPEEIGVGKVRVKFYVRADGVITNLEILEGKHFLRLTALSVRSIRDISSQLEPFSETLREKWGEGYSDEISFRVTDKEEEGGPYRNIINPKGTLPAGKWGT